MSRTASRTATRTAPSRRLLGAAVAAAAVLATAAATAAPASADSGGSYVALGDSYSSAPLVLPIAAGSPLDCLRSSRNYPHVAAADLGLKLTDASCAAAKAENLESAQYPDAPAQFNALTPDTDTVSLGIGGNDNNTFITAVAGCGVIDIARPNDPGAPCKDVFGAKFSDAIASDGANIAHALQGIRQRSPHAKVYVVGYPDILPHSGNCWPQMPLTTGDVAYLDGVEHDLNAMLKTQAEANGAVFVDTYTGSVGHDACRSEATRWLEPVVPSTDAISVHPNAKGEAAMASALEAAMG